jgi:hypothetical protein
MDAKTLLSLIDLQCEYTRLHTRCGLVGVSEQHVHLSLSEFRDLWPGRDLVVEDRHSDVYPVELSLYVFGTKFITVCDLEDLIEHNLSQFCPASLKDKLDSLVAEMAGSQPAQEEPDLQERAYQALGKAGDDMLAVGGVES